MPPPKSVENTASAWWSGSRYEKPSVPNYFDPKQRDRLTEGLVLTIEPLITAGDNDAYEDEDGWTVVDTGIGNEQTRGLWERILANRKVKPYAFRIRSSRNRLM